MLQSQISRKSTAWVSGLFVVLLAACGSANTDRLAAASQALQATGDYQVVAQDAERGLLTLRTTRDGALRVIDVNSVGPKPALLVANAIADHGAVSGATAVRAKPAPLPVADSALVGAAVSVADNVVANPAGMARASEGPASAPTLAEPSYPSGTNVLVNGPHVHIERAAPATTTVRAPVAKMTTLSGVSIDHAVICRNGDRIRLQLVRVDSQSAGIVLQSGCQLELIDSDVRSGDIALVVNAGATLLIENSTIHGRIGSLQASATTRVTSWASDFSGPTLLEGAEFIDRGGNRWQ